MATCPDDFEEEQLGTETKCFAKCPDGFKKFKDEYGSMYCVAETDNSVKIRLFGLSQTLPDYEFVKESIRVYDDTEAALKVALEKARREGVDKIAQHSYIKGTQARFTPSSSSPAITEIREVSDSLKPFRPPTAPEEDIAQERNRILNSSAPNMLVIQISLAIVLICVLAYAFMPPTYAGFLSFLLLSVGIALGIFLRK